ncbi:MAG: saccharopine dehydrogenase NADP-binding domain-containing protein [Saprospiraceae bacterium]|nr:saccharopine dehydrogenase NADP-binding domain-containing protein [Saprospiraceae bacterium]
MNNILIIGAGRSSTALIKYVLERAKENNWFVTVADSKPEYAEEKVGNHPNGRPAWLDAMKVNDRREMIGRADVVVSLLPAYLHMEVAYDCIKLKKHLITASYVSKDMYRLSNEFRDRELIFMGEMGLDPGIDHMSAMKHIEDIKDRGGKITAFRSYTGGLIAPESDDNPWHYKITWNPRNVVLAGQGTAQFMEDGKFKYIPYNRLFQEYHTVNVPGMGKFDAYANRDSLLYREVYGLSGIPNILRGTLRTQGFCDAWNALVQVGLTDASFPIVDSGNITYHELMEAYTSSKSIAGSVKERVAQMLEEEPDSPVMEKLEWLGLFRKKKIKLPNATPAMILENLLVEKWKMKPRDKDMIVMHHEFEYELDRQKKLMTSTMVMHGENEIDTAMTKSVGLPLGIFVKLVMQGKITSSGVHIPVKKEIYEPVLQELEEYGVVFHNQEKDL